MSAPAAGQGAFMCADKFTGPRFDGKELPYPPENDNSFAEAISRER